MTHAKLQAIASLLGVLLVSCSDDASSNDDTLATTTTPTSTDSGEDTTPAEDTIMNLDTLPDTTGGLSGCAGDGDCVEIDLLFVIDNSGTMGEEQLNLAANFPLLVDRLKNLQDPNGNLLNPSVNIMVTTTDFGHPLCTPYQKIDYHPQQGAPVFEGCNKRDDRFVG